MHVAIIGPLTNWFKIVELIMTELIISQTLPPWVKGQNGKNTHDKNTKPKETYSNRSRASVGSLIIVLGLVITHAIIALYTICDNQSEIRLHFKTHCGSYGIQYKPTSISNPQAKVLLEHTCLKL